MARILSDAELTELTGYQVAGKQLEVLRRLGLRPVIRADGRPRITDDALTQAMLGNLPPQDLPAPGAGPNWAVLKKAG
ncbi:DUF4224 domain-containing protein [Flagellatimonas centrodinii]|uniref:DUF4224 domain-containing protein n=1 Tax=Flagellatimonas centrodinii TaxID=2806210 RepID=UPI001FEE33A2|nr:DUF4224 domain-containing protein [Flagellatimonas centrodinii]ULQ46981.1 DUF4224 domain-containing protein [Flagellatimonas centrodinii]